MMGVLLWALLSGVSVGNAAGIQSVQLVQALAPAPIAARGRPGARVEPAKGRFLIASRHLGDPNFAETVVLLLNYDADGAMGIVINRPTEVRLAAALPNMAELRDRPDRVFLGGPVSANVVVMLIRSRRQIESAQLVFDNVYASGSLAVLRKALGNTGKKTRLRAYAGYAGWGRGQLDREIARGDWHVASADAALVFDTAPAAIWSKLIERFSGEWTRTPGDDATVARNNSIEEQL